MFGSGGVRASVRSDIVNLRFILGGGLRHLPTDPWIA
jgi:hypothetical protein